jgi:polysaccharide export outer membrane protein
MTVKSFAMFAGSAALGAMLAGCADTKYAEDPVNPQARFVFPGQTSTATTQALTQPGSATAGVLPPVAVNPSSMVPEPSSTVVLRPQDRVIVSFGDVPVPPPPIENRIPEDGNIVLPYNLVFKAAGKTPSQLQEEIRQAYVPKFFNRLTVNIKTEDRYFFVGGEVRAPNQRIYSSEMTVLRAIDTAGGFTEYANRKRIELHRADGRKEIINWHNAIKDPVKYDRPIHPNDKITVHKRFW